MLSGEKILVTGVTGETTAFPMARHLARDNEVWGLARFSSPDARARVEACGITTRAVDLAAPDFSELPDDFTYVLHYAHTRMGAGEFIPAIQVNAVGATVRVVTGDRIQTQVVSTSNSYGASYVGPLLFGLGETETADRVEVTWPGGSKTAIEGVAANQEIEVNR